MKSSISLLVLLAFAGGARAAVSPWAENPQAKLRLVAAQERVAAGTEVLLGLHFQLAPEWHVYWRNSGDAGFPPMVDWARSSGLASPELLWPAPERIEIEGGLQAFGYGGEVVYPVRATVARDATGSVRVVADVDYLVCRSECVPYREELSLELPVAEAPAADGPIAELVERHLATVPGRLDGAAGWSFAAGATPRGESVEVAGVLRGPEAQEAAEVDVLHDVLDAYDVGRPEIAARPDGALDVKLSLAPRVLGVAPLPVPLRLTFTGLRAGTRSFALEHALSAGPEAAAPPGAPPAAAGARLATMLLLGLLGGLLLNAMPCVLPVLSLKVFSLLKQAGSSRASVRRAALWSAAGIVTSFLLLASAAVAVRGMGVAVGWGIQFQEPLFVAALAVVVTLFALNLWGVFEVALPASAGRLALAMPREGALGHFGSGLLATLLATPCSAPFLGTAMAFALTSPAPWVLAVFLAAGTGMAAPYLLLAVAPGALRAMPRPGPWMESLKTALGFGLALTTVWLLYVLHAQLTAEGLAVVQGMLVLLGLGAWAAGRPGGRALRASGALLCLLAVGGGLVAVDRARASRDPAGAVALGGISWEPFDDARLAALRQAGHPVFVDVTADWCFTCKVNERLVLARPSVAERFDDLGIVALRADWTNRDAGIAEFLRSFGRTGIPFYAYYPRTGTPRALPEVLTEGLVLDALEVPPLQTTRNTHKESP